MPVVMLVAAGAVLIGVIVVALGRGGELADFQADYFPLKLEQISATDVALFRPPVALWGYNAQATDEALNRIATALTERDIELSALQQQVADLEASADRRTRAASDEFPLNQPVTFVDDAPPARPQVSPRTFTPQPPPGARRPARRPDPPFTRSARPDARSRFGLPAASEDEDD
ncbi:MAG TPA: hypothetical protein VGI74_01890 [Streptosporangiaceae bacterium]